MRYSGVSAIVFHKSRFFNVNVQHRRKRNFARCIARTIWKLICTSYISCKAPTTSPFAILKEDKSPKEFLRTIQRQVRKSERRGKTRTKRRRGGRRREGRGVNGAPGGSFKGRSCASSAAPACAPGATTLRIRPRVRTFRRRFPAGMHTLLLQGTRAILWKRSLARQRRVTMTSVRHERSLHSTNLKRIIFHGTSHTNDHASLRSVLANQLPIQYVSFYRSSLEIVFVVVPFRELIPFLPFIPLIDNFANRFARWTYSGGIP